MGSELWDRVSKRKPCPACGRTTWCSTSVQGFIACYRSTEPPRGYKLKEVMADGGHFYVPLNYKGEMPSAEELRARQKQFAKEEKERNKIKKRKAGEEWRRSRDHEEGGCNHAVLHRYLQGRGIDVTLLAHTGAPQIPDSLAFSPDCMDEYDPEARIWSRAPAMVAAISDGEDDRQIAIHRTFLDTHDLSRKRAGDDAKKMYAPRKGGAVRLTPSRGKMKVKPCAVVITEGIETGLAIAASTDNCHVWAALDTSGLKAIELPK